MRVTLVYFGVEVEGHRCDGCGRLYLLRRSTRQVRFCSKRCADRVYERERHETPAGVEGEATPAGADL